MLTTIKNQNNIQFEGKLTHFFSNNIQQIKLSKQIRNEMLKTAKDKEEARCIEKAHVFQVLRMKELCDLGVGVKKAYAYSYTNGYLFEKIKRLAQQGKYERYDFLTANGIYGQKLDDLLNADDKTYSNAQKLITGNIKIDLVLDFLKKYPNDIDIIHSIGITEQIDSRAIPLFLEKKEKDKNFSEEKILTLAKKQIFTERAIYDILTFDKSNIINSKNFDEIRTILAKVKSNWDDYFPDIWSLDYVNNDSPYQSYDFLTNEIFSIQKNNLDKYPLDNQLKIYFELFSLYNSKLLSEEEVVKIKLPEVLAKLEKSIKNPIASFDVKKEDKELFFKNFISNNSSWIENTIKNFDFKKYETTGLPLKYTRNNYLKDLNKTLSNYNENKKAEIYKKLEIIPIDNAKGYDGILTTENLDLDDELENKIYILTNLFIRNNEVITNDLKLNKIANSIIKAIPEYVNIIGKKQHRNQTLDVHSFMVIQNTFRDEGYKTLSGKEKAILKFSALLHDIAKKENVIDKNHPKKSALYANCILGRFNFSNDFKNTIIDTIENHHWLEQYSKGILTADKLARKFRSEENFNLAKIMAKADLKGVGDDFYKYHKNTLSRISPIISNIQKMNYNAQIFLSNKVIKPQLLPKVNHKGKEYKVADFSKYKKDDDLSKIGFEPGTTKENLRLMVHMSNKIENLESILKINDTNTNSLLCASFISLKNKATYFQFKYGLSLDAPNENIINASKTNQASGRKKGSKQLDYILCNNMYRDKIPSVIKAKAKISNSEYLNLYSQLMHYRYVSQIEDDKIYKLSQKEILGKDLKRIIRTSNDKLLHTYHNEVNLYKPTPNAFVAKVNSIEEIPDKYLEFAHKHDLPILILGN